MKRRAAWVCACAIVLSSALAGENGGNGPDRAHALGRLAASMKSGEWKELVTQGYDKRLIQDTRDGTKPVHQIFQYTNKIHWYAKTQQLYFMGAGHASMGKFITYSAADNTWRRLEVPEHYRKKGRSGLSHTYENTTIDPEENLMLRQSHMRNVIERYDLAAGKWIEPIPSLSKGGHRSATEYFPELKTYVRYETGSGSRMYRWDKTAKNWTAIAGGTLPGMPRLTHPVIEYNPVHKLMLVGGGNGCPDLFKMGADGKAAAIRKVPFGYVNSTHINVLTVDPAGGEFLFFTAGGKNASGPLKFFAYDVAKDEWRKVADTTPLGAPKGKVATPVERHGVVLFCTYEPTKVWLYKRR
ncbi:MAG: hypothetical protein ACYTGB_19125 [Planctomycetota bacterium]|jgi:hypothetical protein